METQTRLSRHNKFISAENPYQCLLENIGIEQVLQSWQTFQAGACERNER